MDDSWVPLSSRGPLERAEYLRSLDDEIVELRREHKSLRGVRTSDIKSLLIYMYTGERVSGRTVRSWETTANRIELSLADCWLDEAAAGLIPARLIDALAKLDDADQELVRRLCIEHALDIKQATELARSIADGGRKDAEAYAKEAIILLAAAVAAKGSVGSRIIAIMKSLINELQ